MTKFNNFKVLIPARSTSKRIKDKNIQELADIPLLAWSIKTARSIGFVPIVSSDSKTYLKIAYWYKRIQLRRPPSLSTDNSTDFDVIKHFLTYFPCKFIIYLRPTSPFRKKEVLLNAINSFIKIENKIDCLRSIEKTSESALKWFLKEKNGICRAINPLLSIADTNRPNQELPQTYKPNGIIDIFKRSVIESGSLCGSKVFGFVVDSTIEIDTPAELEYARWYAQNLWIK